MWDFVTANCTGISHTKKGEEGQDKYYLDYDKNWYAVSVCDGAGSSKNGGDAAKIVSSKFTEGLLQIGKRMDLQERLNLGDEISKIIVAIREYLREKTRIPDLKDWQCTLVAVLIGKDGNGISVHVGDGVIFTATQEANKLNIKYVSEPENGEYANETFFVTGKDWYRHLRINILNQIDFIALSTDGASSLFWDDKSKKENNKGIHLGFWNPVWEKIKSIPDIKERNSYLTNLISSEEAQRKSDDDKTLIVLIKNNDDKPDEANYKTNQSHDEKIQIGPSVKTSILTEKPLELITDKRDTSNKDGKTDLLFVLIFCAIIALIGFVIYIGLNPEVSLERPRPPTQATVPTNIGNPLGVDRSGSTHVNANSK